MQTFEDDEAKGPEENEGVSQPNAPEQTTQTQDGEDWTAATLEPSGEEEVKPSTDKGVVNHYPEAFTTSPRDPQPLELPLPTTHPKDALANINKRYGDLADEDQLDALRHNPNGAVHAAYSSLLDTVQDEMSIGHDVTAGDHRYSNLVETRKGNVGLQVAGPSVRKGKELSGRNALLMITTHMGISKLANLPDVNSGIRFIYRAPNATEMAALDERLAQHKDTLGYYTLGLSHSFADSFSQEILFDFLMKYIVDCNLKDWKVDNVVNVGLLKSLIRKSSLKHHYLAIQAAFYSRGYPLVRICTSDDVTCANIMRGDVHFQHTYWVLEDGLTQDQLRFMTHDISHQHTAEEVLTYQASLDYPNASRDLVSETGAKLRLEFDVPNVADDLVKGAEWIKATRRTIMDTKRQFNDGLAEQRFVRKQVETNQLRLFTSWVKRIVVVDPENEANNSYVSNAEDIAKIIESFSNDDRLISEALDGVWRYMDTATKAVVGVPQHTCDVCGKSQEASNMDEAIVPFDPISVFFMCHCPSIARYQKTTAAMQDLV